MRFCLNVEIGADDRVTATDVRLGEYLTRTAHAPPEQYRFFRNEMRDRVFGGAARAAKGRVPDPRGAYVGAAKCAEWHPNEAQEHAGSAHGRASATLLASEFAASTGCISCHTTAPYFQGGWAGPKEKPPSDMAGISCEACHGPGGTHVVEKKKGW